MPFCPNQSYTSISIDHRIYVTVDIVTVSYNTPGQLINTTCNRYRNATYLEVYNPIHLQGLDNGSLAGKYS